MYVCIYVYSNDIELKKWANKKHITISNIHTTTLKCFKVYASLWSASSRQNLHTFIHLKIIFTTIIDPPWIETKFLIYIYIYIHSNNIEIKKSANKKHITISNIHTTTLKSLKYITVINFNPQNLHAFIHLKMILTTIIDPPWIEMKLLKLIN